MNNKRLDKDFKDHLKEFFTFMEDAAPQQDDLWSQDWFEQLYEDACSVLAFGESFVPVLEKILGRQPHRLSADRIHPDLETRIQVARRLLALQRGDAPAVANNVERLTDDLLWAFINQKKSDPISVLPVAHLDPKSESKDRQKVIKDMQLFNEKFGDLLGTINEIPYGFGPMDAFASDPNQKSASHLSKNGGSAGVREKLLSIFADPSVEGLLNVPFSPTDQLAFEGHSVTDQWQDMYIGSNHGVHYIYHWGH